jgi:hypothetical protein
MLVVAGSMAGVADRVRRRATARRAAIDAVAASWTIGGEEGGSVRYRSVLTDERD